VHGAAPDREHGVAQREAGGRARVLDAPRGDAREPRLLGEVRGGVAQLPAAKRRAADPGFLHVARVHAFLDAREGERGGLREEALGALGARAERAHGGADDGGFRHQRGRRVLPLDTCARLRGAGCGTKRLPSAGATARRIAAPPTAMPSEAPVTKRATASRPASGLARGATTTLVASVCTAQRAPSPSPSATSSPSARRSASGE